jgi:hypothetical protein
MLRSAGMILGPALFSPVFAYGVSDVHAWKQPAIGWFFGGVLLFISMFIAARVTNPSDDVKEEAPELVPIVE